MIRLQRQERPHKKLIPACYLRISTPGRQLPCRGPRVGRNRTPPETRVFASPNSSYHLRHLFVPFIHVTRLKTKVKLFQVYLELLLNCSSNVSCPLYKLDDEQHEKKKQYNIVSINFIHKVPNRQLRGMVQEPVKFKSNFFNCLLLISLC